MYANYNFSNHVNSKKINFGCKLVVDCGASNPGGSFKASILPDKSYKEIVSTSGIVCPNGIQYKKNYLKNLANLCVQFLKNPETKVSLNQLKDDDKKLSGMTIFIPGPNINNKAVIISNLKDTKGKSLTNVDFSEVMQILKNSDNIDVTKNPKFLAVNDMLGSTAAIILELTNNPQYKNLLKNDFYGTVCMTGGGCGVANVKIKDNNIEIEASESGHMPTKNSDQILEKYAASVPALITNYASKFGFNEEDTKKLVDAGNAKIVTQEFIKAEKGSEEANALENTGLFDVNPEKGFKLKNFDENKHTTASKNAINCYIDGIAQLCAAKVLEGTNAVFLTGPVVKGIKETLALKGNDLAKLIQKRMFDKYLDASGKNMLKMYNFKIITDIDIKDNTLGGGLLQKGGFVDEKHRGNWVNIPLDSINTQ
ncbi:MAG: hypothetical protein V2B14_04135 [bacterium]